MACLLLTNTATLPVSKGHSRASCPPRDVFGADVAVKKVTATLPGNRGGELSVCFPGGEDGRRGHTHSNKIIPEPRRKRIGFANNSPSPDDIPDFEKNQVG